MTNGYGYQGGHVGSQPYVPVMPQHGMPPAGALPGAWGNWQQGPVQQMMQTGPVNGPLPDAGEEDGFAVPSALTLGGTVPVTRCPNGEWAMSFVMNDREFHTIVYVQLQDGTFAPYHLEGIGALRLAPDSVDGTAYMTKIPTRGGKPVHVLHVPGTPVSVPSGDGSSGPKQAPPAT